MRPDPLIALFTRPLWVDESFTYLVSNHDSFLDVLSDLNRGADFGPPFLYFIAWSIRAITGSITPASLRIVSLVAMLGALVLLFLILRRRWDVAPSVAGTLAVASNQLIMEHAFEARFYATWMLFAVGFAWAFSLDRDSARSRRRDVTLALFAVLLCINHWYGVVSLGLMCAAAMATFGRHWRSPAALRLVAPASAGIVALLMISPLIVGQRGVIEEKSWLPELNWHQVATMAQWVWATPVTIAAVLVILATMLSRARKESIRTSFLAAIRDPSIAALLVHVVMPLILIGLSLLQPSMLPRYALVSVFVWAPLVALAAQALRRFGRAVVVVLLLAHLYASFIVTAASKLEFAVGAAAANRDFVTACKANVPVVFQMRHVMYPLVAQAPERCAQARLLVLSDTTLERLFPGPPPLEWARRFYRFERQYAALHRSLYGFPVSVSEADLYSLPEFYLLASDINLPPGYKNVPRFVANVFPNRLTYIETPNLALLKLKPVNETHR